MSKRDYYEILGLSRSAEASEIKKAYRKIAFENHPDRNQGNTEAEDLFKEAAEAYEVLSDAQKKPLYDQYGHAGLGSAGGAHHYNNAEEIFSQFGDIFEDFFGFSGGGRGQGRRRSHGVDLSYNLAISFEDAVFGTEEEIEFIKRVTCETCEGSGAEEGSQKQACEQCGGHGQVRMNQGFFSVQTTCPQCRGEGMFNPSPCKDCRGSGLGEQEKKVKVKVPAGVDQHTRLVLRGEGEAGAPGGRQGDLYVTLQVQEHELYWREHDQLHASLEISMTQAALGAKLEVETLDGSESIEVSKGIQTGETLRIKKKGIPHVNSKKRGDLILHVFVKTPEKLSRKQSKLLEEFAEMSGEVNASLRKRYGRK